MTFRVGQKVVCIDNSMAPGLQRWHGQTYPEIGPVYTVRAIVLSSSGYECLLLAEIVNPIPDGYRGEGGFEAVRFRPIVERKTDISIFTDMLMPTTPKRARERVGE